MLSCSNAVKSVHYQKVNLVKSYIFWPSNTFVDKSLETSFTSMQFFHFSLQNNLWRWPCMEALSQELQSGNTTWEDEENVHCESWQCWVTCASNMWCHTRSRSLTKRKLWPGFSHQNYCLDMWFTLEIYGEYSVSILNLLRPTVL